MPDCRDSSIDLSPFIRAWKKHYMKKGCAERKAEDLAWEMARKKRRGPIV